MASNVFRRGDLRLFLLGALEDGAKHGYELIRNLEERFAGLYRPSAGSIYPRLAALEDAGLVTHEGRDYALTAAGQAEVESRRDELRELERGMAGTRRPSAHALRAEIRTAAAELRSQERRLTRETRARAKARGGDLAALRVELRVFAADVTAAARRVDADPAAVTRVLGALDEARTAVLGALTEQ